MLSNLIQSASLFISIPLFSLLGLWALVVVNIAGTIIANMVIVMLLRKHGHHFRLDIGLAILVVFYSLLSGIAGWWSLQIFNSYLLSAGLMVLTFTACMFAKPPLWGNEKEMLKVLLMNQLGRRKAV